MARTALALSLPNTEADLQPAPASEPPPVVIRLRYMGAFMSTSPPANANPASSGNTWFVPSPFVLFIK